MKRRDDTWQGSAWEAFCAHAHSSFPLPYWDADDKRYVMCSRCGYFGSTEQFAMWGGDGLRAYMGLCRNCAKNDTV